MLSSDAITSSAVVVVDTIKYISLMPELNNADALEDNVLRNFGGAVENNLYQSRGQFRSGIGIDCKFQFRNWNLIGIAIIGIGIELELPSLELNWNCHNWNWNLSWNCILQNCIRN